MIDRRPALIARCTGTSDVIAAIGFARSEGLDGRCARRRAQRGRKRDLRRRPRDRSLADEGRAGRRRRPHGPRAGRPHVGRARRRDTGLRSRDDRRARDHHRDRRLHARRRHRLDDAQTRTRMRQPDLGRPGHGRRADGARERERERRSCCGGCAAAAATSASSPSSSTACTRSRRCSADSSRGRRRPAGTCSGSGATGSRHARMSCARWRPSCTRRPSRSSHPRWSGTPIFAIACCHLDPEGSAEDDLRPLRDLGPAVDVLGPMPYTAIQGMFDAGAPRGSRNYWRSGYVNDAHRRGDRGDHRRLRRSPRATRTAPRPPDGRGDEPRAAPGRRRSATVTPGS